MFPLKPPEEALFEPENPVLPEDVNPELESPLLKLPEVAGEELEDPVFPLLFRMPNPGEEVC